MEVLKFSDKDFILSTNWENYFPSKFDSLVTHMWLLKEKEGLFRYNLNITKVKVIEGKFRMLAQLNTDRAANRRKPHEFQGISDPFNSNLFNFTKLPQKEIMFKIVNESDYKQDVDDYVAINVSPLEKFHCLILPNLCKCQIQLVTPESLKLALNIILLSAFPGFRVCFNSLCAYASVNHLHFHTYHLNSPMYLETAAVEQLAGRCHCLLDYPAKGFVFYLNSPQEIDLVISDVMNVLNYFKENNIAHNIYLTRGTSNNHSEIKNSRDCIRIYIWARKSANAKILEDLNPAVCELFGHLVIKCPQEFEEITEKSISEILFDITDSIFTKIKPDILKMFSDFT